MFHLFFNIHPDLGQAYSKPPYVISLEVEMRKPGGLLQDLLNYSQSPCCAIKGLGFFAPMGDLPPWTGRPISYVLVHNADTLTWTDTTQAISAARGIRLIVREDMPFGKSKSPMPRLIPSD